MKNELKRYQENAVDELILKTKLLLSKKLDKRTIVFKAPTGSGKTFMMSQYIEHVIREIPKEDCCFLWISIGKGGLHKQSHTSLKKIFDGAPRCSLLEEEFFGSRTTIRESEVVVVNWEKLVNKDRMTGEWKNTLMKDKETTNFRELVQNTKEAHRKIIMIIDESHASASAKGAMEIREVIGADLTIEMSATPTLHEGEYDDKVNVFPNEVIDEGMIKKEILVNQGLDTIGDDDMTSQELVMKASYEKRIELKKELEKEGAKINPLVLIQIQTGKEGEDKRAFVEQYLAEKDITLDNGKLAVWLSEEKINLEVLENNESDVEFVIFKQAIDTGWDCPRAQILVKFRETKSDVFELQTVGRILRMPEAKHYDNDELNKAFIYTNVKSNHLDFKGDEEWLKNKIKAIRVKRGEEYTPLHLRSYYRNRVDFGDLTYSFYESLSNEFCDKFGIGKEEVGPKFFEKNKKRFTKLIDIENLENKDDLVLNKLLDVKLFDDLPGGLMEIDEIFQANLSTSDKENAFRNIMKANLNGFAYKRSIGIISGALYSWFKKYVGIDVSKNNGAIYIQNIVLNNAKIFGELFDGAVKRYIPVKNAEIKKRIEEVETWNNEWEIAQERGFSDTYKPFGFNLSLYKRTDDKKAYLRIDSDVEREFLELLEKSKDKILWWWQNGDEHMALNFGVKYGEGSTFQPDFLVMFKDGRLGIFDTKASGYMEESNKEKAEALAKYIKEENKRKKKAGENIDIFGGIVIKDGTHWRMNGDDTYEPFQKANVVSENKKAYGKSVTQKGWQFFEG